MDEQNREPDEQPEQAEPDLKYRSPKEAAKSGILGLFIGLAVIIPGVSGSAVAIIMKLYEKLLYAIGNLLGQFRKCALFLLPVAVGAVVGFALGFFAVKILLDVAMFAVVALFAGLMTGALPAIKDEIAREKHTPLRIALFVAGLLVPPAISLVAVFLGTERSIDDPKIYEYFIYVLIGFAVALTQLVPGHYVPLVDSVSLTYWSENPAVFAVYACLIVGFVAGLLCFAKLMSLLLERYRAAAFHAVAGLAIGSVITMFFNPEMYAEYLAWAGGERFSLDLALGVILFAAGVAAAYMFVRFQRKNKLPLQNK